MLNETVNKVEDASIMGLSERELRDEIINLRVENTKLSNDLDKAIAFKDTLIEAISKELKFDDYDESFTDLADKVEDLEYELSNIPDEYELVDRVMESSTFESNVEDIVKSTLNSVVLKVEVD